MKQAFFAFFLFLLSLPLFSQTVPDDSLVYILDIEGGTSAEQDFFSNNLRVEIPAAGYTLTDDILEADYALTCHIAGDEEGAGRLLFCSLLDADDETELVSATLRYGALEEAYETLPYILRSLFVNAAHKPPPEIVEVEKRIPVYVEKNPPVRSEVVRETVSKASGPSGGWQGPPEQTDPAAGWKHRLVFLNLRAGPSFRSYQAGNLVTPSASIVTFDAGFESELHFFKALALQLGLGLALDHAEYRQSPSNPWSVVYATSVISVPFMAKYIFNPSPLTTLGPCLGGYATLPMLGAAKPPPFGLLGGLELSVKTGLGILLFDLRYSMDLGNTGIIESAIVYYRTFLTLSAGIKFGFIDKQKNSD